ncbi:MAG: transcriptional regulator Spx [Erysipelotrichaceae bacterium]|nr:transcriptional regulator Spx [Erysipelotrichaceae bacterium]MCI9313255.1 transcriptional regulator Spx [Erysipelotrichaceae bacterium]RKJ75202.1 Spx/MgsR family RNA polymerase-binding regulatory protein [Anaerotruncus sp. 1XD22-93]
MILLYTSPGCASCRKAKQWLKQNDMQFVEKNIFTTLLKENEIKYLLQRTDNGTEDIISTRSKAFQALNCTLEDLSTSQLVDFIQHNPSVLKRPIIINENSFMVGYDDDEITAFVPSHLRALSDRSCTASCPNYNICGRLRKEEVD